MVDLSYTTIDCTACRPKFGSVWIVIDGAGGIIGEQLSLSSIHPDDVEAMEAADKVQPMKLRVLADRAAELGIDTIAKPQPRAVPAFGDLFGA